MKTKYCIVCGSIKELVQHHFIPISLGGKNNDKNIITLCSLHHNFIHKMQGKLNHNQLIKNIKEKRKIDGLFLGGYLPYGHKVEKIIGQYKKRDGSISDLKKLIYDYDSIDYKIVYDIMTLFDNKTTYRQFADFLFKKYNKKIHFTQIYRIKKREEKNFNYWKNIKCTN